MNNYKKILLVALFLLCFSIINEINYPYIDSKPSFIDYIHIYIFRYIHYIIYLMSSFYLIFFNGIGTNFDIYIYLILVFGIVFGWYIFDCCWLSYSELLFYDIDLEHRETTFHPTFHSIFSNYDGYFMLLSGLLYIITVSILLYYLPSVKFIYKFLYYIIFLYFFIDGSVKGRFRKMFYSTNNNQLLFLKNTHDKYIDNIKHVNK